MKIKKKHKTPDFYMIKALEQAQKAFFQGEVPIGAVVVDKHGTIVARAYNKVEQKKTQAAHAESLALTKAAERKKDWRLDDCTVYVTLEPCLMCLGLLYLSRIKRVYFGAQSPLYGYSGYGSFQPFKRSAYKDDIKMVGNLKEQESADMLRAFFVQERKKAKELS